MLWAGLSRSTLLPLRSLDMSMFAIGVGGGGVTAFNSHQPETLKSPAAQLV
jgi:hypothetical protein